DVLVEAELNPSSVQDWLSLTQQGNKIDNGTRRSYLSIKVKKHLLALGWVLSYAFNGKKREMRYKSNDGKWFHSLVDACLSCVDEDVPRRRQQQQQIVPKSDLPCLKNCYSTTAFHKEKTCSFKIVLNTDVSNQQQKKRRKTTMVGFDSSAPGEDKIEIRARTWKSLNKVLQVMEEKNKKCEKGLFLCDGCPSAFHYTCLGLLSLPKEKLCFYPCCCCNVCGSIETSGNNKLMTCEQCQRRFHLKCLKQDPCLVSYRGWFCSRQCSRVTSALQSLVGHKIEVGNEEDLVWTLMRAPNEDEHYDNEQVSKLGSAVKILHQGFEPTKDPLSGRDLVEELIFKKDGVGVGRGLYTVMIEKNNEPITVAAVRVEKNVAEISLLEKQMSRMGVCILVLPAAADVVTTWTQRLELVKHGMLHFAGTVMCHKSLMEREHSGESSLTE
ncbi:hypothetical protein BRARA_E01776, partial [Brassica rapa]